MEYSKLIDKIMMSADEYAACRGTMPRCVFMNPDTIRQLYYENLHQLGHADCCIMENQTFRLFGILIEPNVAFSDEQFMLNNSRLRDIKVKSRWIDDRPYWTAEIVRADGGPVPFERERGTFSYNEMQQIIRDALEVLGDDYFPSNKGRDKSCNDTTGRRFSEAIHSLFVLGYQVYGPTEKGLIKVEKLVDGRMKPFACIDRNLKFYCLKEADDVRAIAGNNGFNQGKLEVMELVLNQTGDMPCGLPKFHLVEYKILLD